MKMITKEVVENEIEKIISEKVTFAELEQKCDEKNILLKYHTTEGNVTEFHVFLRDGKIVDNIEDKNETHVYFHITDFSHAENIEYFQIS